MLVRLCEVPRLPELKTAQSVLRVLYLTPHHLVYYGSQCFSPFTSLSCVSILIVHLFDCCRTPHSLLHLHSDTIYTSLLFFIRSLHCTLLAQTSPLLSLTPNDMVHPLSSSNPNQALRLLNRVQKVHSALRYLRHAISSWERGHFHNSGVTVHLSL